MNGLFTNRSYNNAWFREGNTIMARRKCPHCRNNGYKFMGTSITEASSGPAKPINKNKKRQQVRCLECKRFRDLTDSTDN